MMTIARQMRLAKTLAASLALLFVGCCDETASLPIDPRTPKIAGFSFVGQADKSPNVLIFKVDFEDDGDLGDGEMDILINNSPAYSGPTQLLPVFVQNELSADTKQGSYHFTIEVFYPDGIEQVKRFRFVVGIRIRDKAGFESEYKTVELRASYRG